MSEDRFWLCVLLIVTLGIVSFTGTIAGYKYSVNKMYITEGYTRGVVTTESGYSSIEWIKP